jgi:hypothetical protein
MLMPASPLARLGTFRAELHACFTHRADALFELSDALLCAQTPLPSLPHLSLEPVVGDQGNRRPEGFGDQLIHQGRDPRIHHPGQPCRTMPARQRRRRRGGQVGEEDLPGGGHHRDPDPLARRPLDR